MASGTRSQRHPRQPRMPRWLLLTASLASLLTVLAAAGVAGVAALAPVSRDLHEVAVPSGIDPRQIYEERAVLLHQKALALYKQVRVQAHCLNGVFCLHGLV